MQELAPDSFVEFVESRSASLLRAAWLLTGDAGRAEDLLQTALTATWLRWGTVVARGDPERYVRRILYTTYVTWWRRRWRYEVPSPQPPEFAERYDVANDEAARDAVRRALGALSRQQRAIVVLRYVEQRSVVETAEIMGCSQATVKVQASRALAKLRRDPHLRLDTTVSMDVKEATR